MTAAVSSNVAMRATAPAAAGARTSCLHCGSEVANGSAFCCAGCETVHALLHEAGLDRYYDLGQGAPSPAAENRLDHKWLEPITAKLATTATGWTRLTLDIQGLHCTACVWLLETLFTRADLGPNEILVNTAQGRLTLDVAPTFPLERFVSEVERFGYVVGPPGKTPEGPSRDLLFRMGFAIAIAMNSMTFGIAVYAGLHEGPTYRLFQTLTFALSIVSVTVCGSVFIRSAVQALRRGILHLDLPIAMGIVLAFSSSAYSFFARGGTTSFFDTLNVFIALMLVGRFLQERVIAKNRASLLANTGAEHLYTRRIDEAGLALVRATDVRVGDRLLLAAGDLLVADAVLEDAESAFSLDWISGESEPRRTTRGELVPAGAFLGGVECATLRVARGFSEGDLPALLARPAARSDGPRSTRFWRSFTRVYVVAVLAIASLAFIGWTVRTHDVTRAIDVVTALLIVTCPCAFGIATPLAYEIVQGSLRRGGVMVRSPSLLDRALLVRTVVFDKTGTLTSGKVVVSNATGVAALTARERRILENLAARSSHPKSLAVRAYLERLLGRASFESLPAREHPGRGIEANVDGEVYRLGAHDWARGANATHEDVVFARDGVALAAFATAEDLRPGAKQELTALAREGFETWIVSGDRTDKRQAVAELTGLAADHIVLGASPTDKAAWIASHDHGDMLFLGDGINDTLAAEKAFCSGTPSIDRPFMAARTDFYFVTPGIEAVRTLLAASRDLRRVVLRNLAAALAYNAITVSLAAAGLVTPLVCAVLMPLSSVSTVLVTTLSLAKGSRRWRS